MLNFFLYKQLVRIRYKQFLSYPEVGAPFGWPRLHHSTRALNNLGFNNWFQIRVPLAEWFKSVCCDWLFYKYSNFYLSLYTYNKSLKTLYF